MPEEKGEGETPQEKGEDHKDQGDESPQEQGESHETKQGKGTWTKWEEGIGQLEAPEEEIGQFEAPETEENATARHSSLFAKLKLEHDLAKAVKSDDAEVPIHLWDQAVWNGTPSETEKAALATMRRCLLGRYRWRLWLDPRKYLIESHGENWNKKFHKGNARVIEDGKAVHDILW